MNDIGVSLKEGPPDLDDLFKRFIKPKPRDPKMSQEPPSSSNGGSGGRKNNRDIWGRKKSFELTPRRLLKILLSIAAVVLLLWILFGIFIVKPAERAAILRFGKYIETVGPGPHWVPPLIETVKQLNVDQVSSVQLNALMLTQEENIVSVQFVAQYKIRDLQDYLFNVVNPVDTLGQSLDSAVRQVIGHSILNEILTTGRAAIADKVRVQLQALMDQYRTGIEVMDVTMQPASAPEPVKDAFDDVIKAREDKVRSSNEAMSYANQVLPVAKGKAMQMVQLAKAGASQSVNNAKAELAGFEALLPLYMEAPLITETRLYFETLEKVLAKNHVIVASETGKNMIYFPSNGVQNTQGNLPLPAMNAGNDSVGSASSRGSTDSASADSGTYPRWKQAQTEDATQGDKS